MRPNIVPADCGKICTFFGIFFGAFYSSVVVPHVFKCLFAILSHFFPTKQRMCSTNMLFSDFFSTTFGVRLHVSLILTES